MSLDRNPIHVTAEQLRPYWYNPEMTVKEIAKRLGYRSVRAFMKKAAVLGMTPRRQVFWRGRHQKEVQDVDAMMASATAAHQFACLVCGTRSPTLVHASCQAATSSPVRSGR